MIGRMERSRFVEALGARMFSARGYTVRSIVTRDKSGSDRDEGDLLVYKIVEEGVHTVRVVDVKENRNWNGGEFPFPTVMLTAGHLHPDWLYLVVSTNLMTACMIDMRDVPAEEVTETETNHPTGGKQISKAVPARYGKFFEIDDVIQDRPNERRYVA